MREKKFNKWDQNKVEVIWEVIKNCTKHNLYKKNPNAFCILFANNEICCCECGVSRINKGHVMINEAYAHARKEAHNIVVRDGSRNPKCREKGT